MVERILQLLKDRGVTAYKLTSDLGIGSGSVSDWKKGRAKPSYGSLVKIADYFDVAVEYLEGKTDIPEKKQPLSNQRAAEVLRQALAQSDLTDGEGELSEAGAAVISRFILANQDMLKKLIKEEE